jgi:hypothetical protein
MPDANALRRKDGSQGAHKGRPYAMSIRRGDPLWSPCFGEK